MLPSLKQIVDGVAYTIVFTSIENAIHDYLKGLSRHSTQRSLITVESTLFGLSRVLRRELSLVDVLVILAQQNDYPHWLDLLAVTAAVRVVGVMSAETVEAKKSADLILRASGVHNRYTSHFLSTRNTSYHSASSLSSSSSSSSQERDAAADDSKNNNNSSNHINQQQQLSPLRHETVADLLGLVNELSNAMFAVDEGIRYHNNYNNYSDNGENSNKPGAELPSNSSSAEPAEMRSQSSPPLTAVLMDAVHSSAKEFILWARLQRDLVNRKHDSQYHDNKVNNINNYNNIKPSSRVYKSYHDTIALLREEDELLYNMSQIPYFAPSIRKRCVNNSSNYIINASFATMVEARSNYTSNEPHSTAATLDVTRFHSLWLNGQFPDIDISPVFTLDPVTTQVLKYVTTQYRRNRKPTTSNENSNDSCVSSSTDAAVSDDAVDGETIAETQMDEQGVVKNAAKDKTSASSLRILCMTYTISTRHDQVRRVHCSEYE